MTIVAVLNTVPAPGWSLTPMALQHEIHKTRPFDSPEQEAYLSLVRSASLLGADFDRFFKCFNLTAASYNVLRILRSAGECGRMCHEIAEHMIAQVPDVTRLVDRLETEGLAMRARCSKDRRVVYVTISEEGAQRLASIDGALLAMHRAQLGHMSPEQLARLVELLAEARRGAGVDPRLILSGFPEAGGVEPRAVGGLVGEGESVSKQGKPRPRNRSKR